MATKTIEPLTPGQVLFVIEAVVNALSTGVPLTTETPTTHHAPKMMESAVEEERNGKTRAAVSSETVASRQLQGRYLGLIRQFSPNKRKQFKKTAKEKGREAAIKEMQKAL